MNEAVPEEHQALFVLFEAEAVDLRRAAEVVRRRHPELARKIVASADQALAGLHILPGTGAAPYFVGDPVAWAENRVGDDEYVWVLNRMNHWPTLGQAALLTGDSRYTARILDEWRDWIERCAPPDLSGPDWEERVRAVSPWRLLEVGIRSFASWHQTLPYLQAAGVLEPEMLDRILGSVEIHAGMLSDFGPRLWPEADHNHLLMEMLGLFSIACRYRHFPQAAAWRKAAMLHLERCLAAQVTAEGGQIEGCPQYHNGCMDFFSRALILARKHGLEFSASFQKGYRRGIEYTLHATRPTGIGVPWGDSDPDRHPVAATIRAGLATGDLDPLRTLAKLVDPEVIDEHLDEFIWEAPDIEAMREALEMKLPPSRLPSRMKWYRALQQVTVRSGWEKDSLSLFFACRTPVQNGHAHIDPGSFDLCARGKAMIVDPGRFTYRSDSDRYDFKRAASHTMLLIDERDPFEYRSTWEFGPQRAGAIREVFEGDGWVRIVAEHENYHPAIHRRTCFVVAEMAVLLVDEVSGLRPEQTVQLYFHVDSTTLGWDGMAGLARTGDPDANVAIFAPPGLEVSFLPGRISEKLDVSRASTRLRLHDGTGPVCRTYLTLIVPFEAGNVPLVELPMLMDGGRVRFRMGGSDIVLPLNPETQGVTAMP